MSGIDEVFLVLNEEFIGGFGGGGVGIILLNFLNGAVKRLPFLEFGIAAEGGGEAARLVVVDVGIKHDEGQIREQGVVVVFEGEIGIAQREQKL